MKRQRVTIKDVAAQAGVSYQTVSRVLNAKGEVAEETRARIQAAIDALEYRPSAIARSLVSQRTHVLGLLTADFSDYTHARIIEGAEMEARRRGYLTFVSGGEHGPDGEPLTSPLFSQHQTDGLLIVYHGADRDQYAIFEQIPRDLPLVTIGYAPGRPGVATVGVQNLEGGRQATEHLLHLGHRRIATITGPMQMYASKERRQGYAEALQAAGLAVDGALTVEGDWSSDSGYRATRQLLARAEFTALFVQNDRMAMGALQALRQQGRRVPEAVAVVGFDDIPSTPYFDPPLTTVHQPTYELGEAAVGLLIDLINGETAPATPTRLPTPLVVRCSCGAAQMQPPSSER